ncbi:MAG: potassium-transporting ATPase subunit F [Bdellovibrionales bacterium]|nr:potassium-transporting ATPase subunit F [Bdellovibrionales bacterium]
MKSMFNKYLHHFYAPNGRRRTKRGLMDFVIVGFVGLGVLIYLGITLFNPERF